MNIRDMSISELNTLYQEINKEISRRQREQKEAAWRKVREALSEYFSLYGEIKVETWDYTYRLTSSADMSECGIFDIEEG